MRRFERTTVIVLLGALSGLVAFGALALAQPPKRHPAASASFEQLAQRAAAARQAEKLDDAINLYQQAVKQKPRWLEGWWSLGTIYYQLDRYREGRDAFQRLVALEPKGGVGWAFLGLCEYQLKDYPNALSHLLRGRELGLGNDTEIASVAFYHTGILLNREEQFELAFAVLSQAAKLQRESRAMFEAMGLTLLRLSYLPSETPPAKREVVLKAGRAGFYMAAEQRMQAAQEFSELLTAFPNEPNVHYAHGIFLMRDAPDEGLKAFQQELQISPQHVFAMLQIAFEYIKRRDFNAGLPYAEQAVKLEPNLFAAHNALGRILLELGQTERAIKELEISVKQAPDSPETHFALSRAYAKAGRKIEAERARNEFTRLDKIRRANKENLVGDTPETKAKPE
ncbi:MAG TPA: tetratricopeptide repeat protein [Blastocatellia bacterium]|nr:tetratricopeptide repeat protein [Blastocatellia bacterium]